MDDRLKDAIRLRTEGNKDSSRKILLDLVAEHPNNPTILYHCAWTHDAMGLEREAVEYYERAIQHGLEGDDLAGAYLGVGSTLRGLGEYKRALEVLENGVRNFPRKRSLRVFLSMALYNAKRSKDAVTVLLNLLVETTNDSDITRYERAIRSYAEDLDRIWKQP